MLRVNLRDSMNFGIVVDRFAVMLVDSSALNRVLEYQQPLCLWFPLPTWPSTTVLK